MLAVTHFYKTSHWMLSILSRVFYFVPLDLADGTVRIMTRLYKAELRTDCVQEDA